MSRQNKLPVAVLAATGTVGQRFVSLLADHPWFEIVQVFASERSAGRRYAEAVNWVIPSEIPARTGALTVEALTGAESLDERIQLVFSALPSAAAREIEPQLAGAGYIVCSNASALRMEPDVPLLIPEINPDHVGLIATQRAQRGWPGLIVTSPNCATTSIIFPLRALHDAFGLEQVHVVTMQAISGAGYPGVASFDILDNVIPYIKGEEDKIENEPRKMLGSLENGALNLAEFAVSAQVHRVPVMDGHMAALSVKLATPASLDDVRAALDDHQWPEIASNLPASPARTMIIHDEPDRPQPRRDRDAENGMAISVGRLQACSVLDFKLVALAHNTLRGAAGGAILNAEQLVVAGYAGNVQETQRLSAAQG